MTLRETSNHELREYAKRLKAHGLRTFANEYKNELNLYFVEGNRVGEIFWRDTEDFVGFVFRARYDPGMGYTGGRRVSQHGMVIDTNALSVENAHRTLTYFEENEVFDKWGRKINGYDNGEEFLRRYEFLIEEI